MISPISSNGRLKLNNELIEVRIPMLDVDVVVLWVDGNDPDWLAEKGKYDAKESVDSNGSFHFRDYGLMKYWFRAIEKYMPWVKKIHFVTWGHLPPFLNTANPKLNIVRHQDYMPEGTLPCFNSRALEMNLFRIGDLSERFIYFNDDMFVLRPMKKTDFFTENGRPCFQFSESTPIYKGSRGSWQMCYINDLSIINDYFDKRKSYHGRFGRYCSLKYGFIDNVRSLAFRLLYPHSFAGMKVYHVPAPFCKKTFETIWEKEPELMAETSRHRFRKYTDVNQWLAIMWQLAEGDFHPRRMNAMNVGVNLAHVDQACDWIRKQSFELLCLNDGAPEEEFQVVSNKLQKAFEVLLPDKCSFEV